MCSARILTVFKTPFQEFPHAASRFSHVHMDIVGPLESSFGVNGETQPFRYVVTFIDRFTRWIEAQPVSGISAQEVAQAFITTWVSRFGVPLELVTDRGRQFESQLFTQL